MKLDYPDDPKFTKSFVEDVILIILGSASFVAGVGCVLFAVINWFRS